LYQLSHTTDGGKHCATAFVGKWSTIRRLTATFVQGRLCKQTATQADKRQPLHRKREVRAVPSLSSDGQPKLLRPLITTSP